MWSRIITHLYKDGTLTQDLEDEMSDESEDDEAEGGDGEPVVRNRSRA